MTGGHGWATGWYMNVRNSCVEPYPCTPVHHCQWQILCAFQQVSFLACSCVIYAVYRSQLFLHRLKKELVSSPPSKLWPAEPDSLAPYYMLADAYARTHHCNRLKKNITKLKWRNKYLARLYDAHVGTAAAKAVGRSSGFRWQSDELRCSRRHLTPEGSHLCFLFTSYSPISRGAVKRARLALAVSKNKKERLLDMSNRILRPPRSFPCLRG